MLDPRGPRFAAAITTAVFILVLAFSSAWLALAQAMVFALTAFTPYGPYTLLYKRFVAPRLGPPGELEAPQPVRFAQIVGLVFTLVCFLGYLLGAPVVGMVAAGFALAAAFLNAAFGFCLGCEFYLLLRRTLNRA
jgi:Domain of unknown function (DUF4395)